MQHARCKVGRGGVGGGEGRGGRYREGCTGEQGSIGFGHSWLLLGGLVHNNMLLTKAARKQSKRENAIFDSESIACQGAEAQV